ncbi:MAG: hypothetical protein IJW86_07275 [Clostridia bacterium]|nr:hypothetical protein [Clostridia bacterium]
MKIKLTDVGKALLLRALAGETIITFTKLQLGNSTAWLEGSETSAIELKNPIQEVDFTGYAIEGNYISLTAQFSNTNISAGFHITELGFFAKDSDEVEYLYAIGLEKEETADYVPGYDERVFEFELGGILFIGDSENVTAVLNDSLTNVTVEDFKKHVEDYNNPHRVTKNDVGLGNVQNLHINDQLPEFTEAQTLENIISGKDKMSALLGKIKKAISELIKHLKDTDNPHEISATKLGAAQAKHEHTATEIKSGVLSVLRGGTGKGQFRKNAVLIGNDKEPIQDVKGTGAFFSDGANTPEFDTLPVKFGGTGLTEGAKFDGSDDYGCYGSVVLPGGLLVQWGRLNCGDRTVSVNFLQKFADTRYALIFTTSAGGIETLAPAMPDWRVPEKSIDSFTIARDVSVGSQVADWVAFGRAPENN